MEKVWFWLIIFGFFWHFINDCNLFGPRFWLPLKIDLLIYSYKMIKNSIYFRIQINHAAFICLQFIGARKWKKSRSILLLSLVHLHLSQGGAGGWENVLQGEQWEVPLKNACKYYFFHMPLLFCCMILFLTVLWLHQYWLCHHHVICCLYATYHLMFKHVFTI